MAQYDGSIRIGTGIDKKGFQAGSKELEAGARRLAKSVSDSLGEGAQIALQKQTDAFIKLNQQYAAQEQKVRDLAAKLHDMQRQKVETPEFKELTKDLDNAKTSLERLYERRDSYAELGKKAPAKLELDISDAERKIRILEADIKELQLTNKAYVPVDTSKVQQELAAAEQRQIQMYNALQTSAEALDQKTGERVSKEEAIREKMSAEAAEEERLAQIRENAVVNNNNIVQTVERIRQLEQEIADLKAAGITEGYSDYEDRIQELSRLRQEVKDYNANIGQVKEAYKKLSDTVKSSFDSIGNVLKKANSAVNSFGRKIKDIAQKHLPFFRKETEKAKGSLSGFAGRLKSLALSLLIFNQISAAFRKVSSSISSGFKNLYEDNERFRSSIDGLKASVLTLENAFAAAFRPIVDIAVPYIQKLVAWLTEAVNLAGQFIAALTGRKTYTRAIKQSAAASEEAAEATEDETKAMNKQLSPLDKLNVLTSENAKNKEKDKDTGLGSGIGTMFEEVPIESGILDAVEKFKDILSRLFAPLKEAWEREGQFVMDSWKYALDEVWKLIKDIGRDFLTVWQQPETVDMFADILHIVGDIGLIVGHLARNFREAWNENETGLHILENIRDIIAVIIHNIRLAADFTVEWADKLNFSPLLQAFERFTASLVSAVDALSGVLTDFYTKVLLPLGKWVLEKGLPELLDVFTAFNKKVDWEALRRNLAEFWEHLEPFAETVGEGLIIFIERISELVANFINSDAFINFLHSVEDWMDSVTPEDVADAIEKLAGALIGLKAALLAFKVGGVISKGLTALIANLQTLAAMGAIAASVYVGIEFSKDYKEWKNNIEKYGWYEGRRKTAEENPANPYRNGTAITQEDGSGVFDQWMENLRAWQESNRKTREAEKEAQNQWLEEMKEKFRSIGEFIKNDWNNSYMGQMIKSFTDGSWKEALSLWGEDLKAGIKSVGEFIKDDWNNSYMGQMISSFTDGSWKKALELWGSDIKESWSRTWTFAKDKVTSIFQTIESIIGSAVAWISGKIQSILNLFSQVSTAARGMTSGKLGSTIGGAFGGSRSVTYSVPYSANPAFAALSTTPIPKLATGAVIPANREFLAVLGDQKHGTNIEAPLGMIEEAVINAIAKVNANSGNNNSGNITLEIPVIINGIGEIGRAVQKFDREFFKQTGRHAFT